jgi:hypothetical protein
MRASLARSSSSVSFPFGRFRAFTRMKIHWITLLVLSPAILYGCALLFVAVYRGRCPRCHRHGLRRVGGFLWDGRTEEGKPCGGSVSFFLCQFCSAHLRRAGRDWSDASDDDWQRHVPTRPNQAAAPNPARPPRFQLGPSWRGAGEPRR